MKKIRKQIFLFLGLSAILSADIFPIGTVLTSILNEKQFQEQMGKEWVLMDGRKISKDDDIHPYLINHSLPDSRGQFLRGLDQSGKVDPDGKKRKLGDKQGDTTKMPNKKFTTNTTGQHTHKYNDIYWSEVGGNIGRRLAGNYGRDDRDNKGYGMNRTTKPAGNHSHTISGGDSETRPKNIAVNFFVKIRSCVSKQCK